MSYTEVGNTMDERRIQSFFVWVVITAIVAFLITKIMTISVGIIHFIISKKGKDVFDNGEPLQIVRITNETKDHKLELNIENLEKIMFHPDVKENPVVIISIAGPFRKGKSFLLGFFLKYLETQSKVFNNQNLLFRGITWIFDSICFFNTPAKLKGNWLRKNDKIKGFKWRGGTERVTSGIHIWSKPFICENKDKEKITVLLMDTQGVFDNDSTVKDCASLFALTNLISSVQIYNLMQQLQEDDLQHLEFFTAFGKLVQQESNETDFNNGKFIYLIRDWGFPYEYPYGKDGGNGYIKKQLEMNSDRHEELQELRRKLSKYFPNIEGFLLPHPGKTVVTIREYDGQVKDMDDDFVHNVKMFVLHILSMEMLIAKRIHNKTLTGKDIVKYIKAFVELLEKGEYPSPQTAFQATAEVGRGEAIKSAFKFYKDKMDIVCRFNSENLISMESFKTHHKESKVAARDILNKTSKLLISEHECECMQNLNILIKEEYTKLRKILDEKLQNFALQQEANRAAAAEKEAKSTLSKLKTVGTGIGFGFGAAALAFQEINKYLKREK